MSSAGGVDWLDVTCWLDWDYRKFTALGSELNRTRELAIRRQRSKIRPSYETDEGDKLLVCPSGGRAGGLYFSWRLQSEQGITIQLQDRPSAKSGMANAHVHIGAMALLQFGPHESWRIARGLLEQLGAQVVKTSCSRIDLAADLLGVDTGVHTRAMMQGRYLCRARKGERFADLKSHPLEDSGEQVYFTREKFTGFRIGRGDVVMRFYDKVDELSTNPDKLKMMVERRWHAQPEKAARCEFQVRHNGLNKFGVRSVEQALEALPHMAEYFPNEWYVQTVGVPDRRNKNQSRSKVAGDWRVVQDTFRSWTGTPGPKLPPIKTELSTTSKLERGAIGYLAAIAARRHDVEQWDEQSLALAIVNELIADGERAKEFREMALAKRQALICDGYGPQLGEFNSSPIGDVEE